MSPRYDSLGRPLSDARIATGTVPLVTAGTTRALPVANMLNLVVRTAGRAPQPGDVFGPDESANVAGIAGLWFDSSTSRLWYSDGTESFGWVEVAASSGGGSAGWTIAAAAPADPDEGDGWYDTAAHALSIWDGSAWARAGGAIPHIPVIDHELGTFAFPAAGDPNALARDQLVFVNSNNAAQRLLYIRPGPGADRFVGAHWKVGFSLDVGGATVTLAAHQLPPTELSNGTYRAHYTAVGNLPAQGSSGIAVRVPGDVDEHAAEATKAEMEAGTEEGVRRVSPKLSRAGANAVPRSVAFATDFATNPPTDEGGELVCYTAAPSDDTDAGQNIDLSSIRFIRLSLGQAAPGNDPGAIGTDTDAVDLVPLIDRAIESQSGVVLTFDALDGNNNPLLSEQAAVYAASVTRAEAAGADPAHIQLADLTWGAAPRTPDNGSVGVNCRLSLASPIVAGLVSRLAAVATSGRYDDLTGTEQIAIDAFVADPATLTLDDYDVVDSIAGANPTGKIDLTEDTGDPAPLVCAITRQSKTAGSGGDNKAALESIGAGDEILVHQTQAGTYVFGTVLTVQYQDGAGNAVAELPDSDGQVNFTYELDADRGLDAYDQLAAGPGRFHFRRAALARDLANVEALAAAAKTLLRAALPTGTEQTDATLTAAMKIMLADFDETTLESFVRWHDIHHTGVVEITGLTFTAGGVSNANADRGKVAWPGTGDNRLLTTNPLTDLVKATLLAAVLQDREVVIRQSAAKYKRGKARSVITETNGLLTVAFDDVTEPGGALTDGASIAMDVNTNVAARDEIIGGAFKANAAGAADRYIRSTGNGDGEWAMPEHGAPTDTTEKGLATAGAVAKGLAKSKPGWRGVRRELTGELSGASGTGWYNVLSCQLSVPADARLRVRGIVYGARAMGQANLYLVRIRKVSGGSTTGIHGTGDYNPIELRPIINAYGNAASTWNDWIVVATPFEFEFDGPAAAGDVRINLAINAARQASSVELENENVYINRGQSTGTQQLPGSEGPWRSWMELAYFDDEEGAAHGVSTTTVTTRDAA